MEGAKAFAANSRRDNRPAPGCAAVVSRSAFPSLRPDLPHSTKSSASSAAIVSGEPHTSGRKRSSSSLCSSAASADPRLIIHATSVEHFRCSPTLAVSGGPHGQPHAGHGCPLWPVRSSAWFGGGSALVLATSPRSQGAPAESRRPPTAGTASVPIAPPAHPRAEG